MPLLSDQTSWMLGLGHHKFIRNMNLGTTEFMKAKKLNQSRMCRGYDKSTHSAPNGASVGSNDAPGRWRVCGGECARRWGPAEEQLCVQSRRGEQRKCTKETCGIRSSAVEPSTWGSLDNPTELSSTTIRFAFDDVFLLGRSSSFSSTLGLPCIRLPDPRRQRGR